MPQITILVGPPGAGKSSLANDMIYNGGDHGAQIRYINQDTQGKDHLKLFHDTISEHVGFRKDIVVDRLNFDKKQRARYLEPAKKAGYTTKIIVLHESRYICLDRCEKRKQHPTITTKEHRENAIGMFFKLYERPTEDEADVVEYRYPERFKAECVIVDIDGTLSNTDHRQFTMDGPKKDWKTFFELMDKDPINEWCQNLLWALRPNKQIVLCSGRPDNYREITEVWLKQHGIHNHNLYMRPRNDSRRDDIVKEILLDFEVKTRYTPIFCIDDRKQVIDMYRKRGLVVLDCAGEKGHF